jgi:TRAP transporter TAXI family solute receptor
MRKCVAIGVAAAALSLNDAVALAAAEFKIVTASTRGTYIQIGRDIASYVAPQADIDLDVLPSAGSAENVRRLRYEPGVKFAIVQSDVYQAFLDQASGGNAEANNIIRPLRVIVPLYNEEIYFIVRADSNLNYIHEIKDAKINAGELGSGTALTTSTLYRLMFNEPLPEAKTSFVSNEDALVKLITDKTLDVVAVIAGQPAKLLVDMKPEAREFIKLLKFDPNHAASKAALRTGDGARQQLCEFTGRGYARSRGEGVPGDLSVQLEGNAGLFGAVRAVAVPKPSSSARQRAS